MWVPVQFQVIQLIDCWQHTKQRSNVPTNAVKKKTTSSIGKLGTKTLHLQVFYEEGNAFNINLTGVYLKD